MPTETPTAPSPPAALALDVDARPEDVPVLTPEEYLRREREASERHEYLDGYLLPVAGASETHVRIVLNLSIALGPALLDQGCFAGSNDMRVRVDENGMYAYPDFVAVCGEPPRYTADGSHSLVNPTLLVEVLSPSTRNFDRSEKFARYRALDTLAEYLTVEQHAPHVELHTRQPDGRWLLTETRDLGATLRLESVACDLPLADLYRRVLDTPTAPDASDADASDAPNADAPHADAPDAA
jgi:Uma2 family endonuclease